MIFVSERIDVTAWEELIAQSSTANFFQTKECYDFYSGLSFLEAFVFGVTENGCLKGIVVGYIQKDGGKLKQYFSRRAIVTGGALLADDISDKALSALLTYCRNKLNKKAIYIEFRNFKDYSLYRDVFRENDFEYIPHLNFHIDCSSEEVIQKNLHSSKKRDIKAGFRKGAILVDSPSLDEVREYYRILVDLYRNKVKTPLFPFDFFEKLYQSDWGRILLIKYQNQIIGGVTCSILKNKTLYHWFVAGLDERFKSIRPSTLATWAAIDRTLKERIPISDMMGAGKADENFVVRDFKAAFGGKLVEYGRFLCILNPVLYHIGKIGVKILKRIKQ